MGEPVRAGDRSSYALRELDEFQVPLLARLVGQRSGAMSPDGVTRYGAQYKEVTGAGCPCTQKPAAHRRQAAFVLLHPIHDQMSLLRNAGDALCSHAQPRPWHTDGERNQENRAWSPRTRSEAISGASHLGKRLG